MRYQLLSLPLMSLCLMLPMTNAETPQMNNQSEESIASVEKAPEIPREQAMYAMGYAMAHDIGLSWDWSEKDLAAVFSGMKDAAAGLEEPDGFDSKLQAAMKIYNARRSEVEAKKKAARKAMLDKRKAEEDAYFAELDKNKSIQKTESGLRYEIIEPGDPENMPNSKSRVKVNYVGTLTNGKIFDSTRNGKEPADFVLSRMIKGFSEGLQLIGVGGKIKLYVPSYLAYGDHRRGALIEPVSTLIFEVELLNVEEATSIKSDKSPGLRTPPPPPNITPPPLPANLKPPTTLPPGYKSEDKNTEVE